jgi:hypothetical protein
MTKPHAPDEYMKKWKQALKKANDALRCGAKTRLNGQCQAPAMKNGRCRMHGGKSVENV